ncbi:MAG: flagellar basal body-associated FliL family protein [Pseudomonadota bacterium]
MAKEEAPTEGEAPKKKGKLLIIILALVGVVVLAGGGLAAWLLMSAPDKSKKAKAEDGGEEGHGDAEAGEEEEEGHDEHPPVYEKLDQFTVNLADQETYLQTEIQLLVASPEVQAKIKERMPEVRDAMIRLLSSKMPEDLSMPDGKTKLADEVQKEINDVLGIKKKSQGVKKVLFGAFIIQ